MPAGGGRSGGGADMSATALPTELQVEVTGACNLRCHMCLVRYRPPINKVTGSMTAAEFERLLDALPDLQRVTLQGLGEPLMAPDLIPMIAMATARGIEVGFNTNGTILTRKRAAQLVDAGLGWLHVSVDGATAATYEAIRDQSNFARVARNVRGLVEVMRDRGASTPRLQIVFVAQRANVAELPDLVDLVHQWGVPDLRVQNLSHDFSDTDPAGSFAEIRAYTAGEALAGDADQADVSAIFAEARRRADALGVTLRLPAMEPPPEPRPAGTPGCDWPWRSAYVTHDSKVQPCCMIMGSDRAVLGDAAVEPIDTIWRSRPYEEFRQRLLGDDPPAVCRGCSMYRGVF